MDYTAVRATRGYRSTERKDAVYSYQHWGIFDPA